MERRKSRKSPEITKDGIAKGSSFSRKFPIEIVAKRSRGEICLHYTSSSEGNYYFKLGGVSQARAFFSLSITPFRIFVDFSVIPSSG